MTNQTKIIIVASVAAVGGYFIYRLFNPKDVVVKEQPQTYAGSWKWAISKNLPTFTLNGELYNTITGKKVK